MNEADGFLSRWSRRKALVREGREPPPPAPPVVPVEAVPVPQPVAAEAPLAARTDADAPPAAVPPPTLDEVATLTPASDFRRFVAREVDPDVKNAALKKLFADPQFNVMDGLDTYIDDYNKPDPLPEGMLRQMVQAQFLGLFSDEDKPDPALAGPASPSAPAAEVPPATPTEPKEPSDEDADLRLQPHDAADAGDAGPAGAGAGEDAGREC